MHCNSRLLNFRLDDIQDASPLRRGQPSTHEIYGSPQTVNSATYEIIQAADKVRALSNPSSPLVFFGKFFLPFDTLAMTHRTNEFADEVRRLFVGQSHDLYWVHNVICPSVADYIKMIDGSEFETLLPPSLTHT